MKNIKSQSDYLPNSNELLDRKELAKRLKVDPRTVYNLEIRRVIPSVRVGNRVRYNWLKISSILGI
jgi:excisionase family DNA binding protein